MHIGKKVKSLVENTENLTVRAFAEALEMTEQNCYKIFKSENLNTELLKKISDFLKVPITSFFEDSDVNNSYYQSGIGNFSGNTTGNKIKQKIMPGGEKGSEGGITGNIAKITFDLQACLFEKKSLERELDLTQQLLASKDQLIAQLQSRA